MGNEDTHPRLTPLILVEPYGKPNVGSRFAIVGCEGVACAVHVWAKRSTTAAAASMVRRDMGLDAGGGKEKRGGIQWHNPTAALSLLGGPSYIRRACQWSLGRIIIQHVLSLTRVKHLAACGDCNFVE